MTKTITRKKLIEALEERLKALEAEMRRVQTWYPGKMKRLEGFLWALETLIADAREGLFP